SIDHALDVHCVSQQSQFVSCWLEFGDLSSTIEIVSHLSKGSETVYSCGWKQDPWKSSERFQSFYLLWGS
ncbi:hypothetical protein FRX31_014295, partial [Thalictrum thalictroides]